MTAPCRKCSGSGIEPAKPEWTEPAEKPPPTCLNVNVPKDERPNGGANLRAQIALAGDALHDELGYTALTPPYYILAAVLHDWLGSRGAA
jgi:hypothetical protein